MVSLVTVLLLERSLTSSSLRLNISTAVEIYISRSREYSSDGKSCKDAVSVKLFSDSYFKKASIVVSPASVSVLWHLRGFTNLYPSDIGKDVGVYSFCCDLDSPSCDGFHGRFDATQVVGKIDRHDEGISGEIIKNSKIQEMFLMQIFVVTLLGLHSEGTKRGKGTVFGGAINIGRKTDVDVFMTSCAKLSVVVYVKQARQPFDESPQLQLGNFKEETTGTVAFGTFSKSVGKGHLFSFVSIGVWIPIMHLGGLGIYPIFGGNWIKDWKVRTQRCVNVWKYLLIPRDLHRHKDLLHSFGNISGRCITEPKGYVMGAFDLKYGSFADSRGLYQVRNAGYGTVVTGRCIVAVVQSAGGEIWIMITPSLQVFLRAVIAFESNVDFIVNGFGN